MIRLRTTVSGQPSALPLSRTLFPVFACVVIASGISIMSAPTWAQDPLPAYADSARSAWSGSRNSWAAGASDYVEGVVTAPPGYNDLATSMSVWLLRDHHGLPVEVYSTRKAAAIPPVGTLVRVTGKRNSASRYALVEESIVLMAPTVAPMVSPNAASVASPTMFSVTPTSIEEKSDFDPAAALPLLATGGLFVMGVVLFRYRTPSEPVKSSISAPLRPEDNTTPEVDDTTDGITPEVGLNNPRAYFAHSVFSLTTADGRVIPLPAKELVKLGKDHSNDIILDAIGVSRWGYEIHGAERTDADGVTFAIGITTNKVLFKAKGEDIAVTLANDSQTNWRNGDQLILGGEVLTLISRDSILVPAHV